MENGKRFTNGRVLLSLLSVAAMVAAQVAASLLAGLIESSPLPFGAVLGPVVYGAIYVVCAWFLIRLVCVRALKTPLEAVRIGRPRATAVWAACAFLLPVLVSLALICTPGRWIGNQLPPMQVAANIARAVFQVGMGAGVVEELVFRGVLMSALESRWNRPVAVLLPSMAFGLLHVLGAQLDALSILFLFIAGTGVGVLFSLVVYESGSVWCGAMMHGVWNCVMIGRIVDIGAAHDAGAVLSYQLTSPSFLVTGGDFGVEASAFAILGYAAFSVLALYLLRRKRS